MHTESSYERRGRGPRRPPFRRRNNRHPGLAERDTPQKTPEPKGEIPAVFAENVFGSLHPMLQHAVAEAEYATPTPIQEKAIPHLLEGKDLLGCAQTGTGKTAAFLLPILHRLAQNPKTMAHNTPRALILAPTRELAAQIATSTTTYGKFIGLPFAVVFGGVSQYPQVNALNRGAVLVVATPGRLLDLMEQGHVSLDGIEEFVLDEADRMLDMGFMPDIKRILSKLPTERHTQFFSATLSPEIMRLAMSMVKDPVHITISPDQPTVDKINQKIMFVDKPNKDALLTSLLTNHPEFEKVIVFARTRHGADKIVRKLEQAEIRAESIHSDKTQRMRTEALAAFRKGRVRVLVATDIASRGIDVDGITHVVNFDLPEETESYVHRIGRTARAGAAGAAISFVSTEERGLLRAVERMIRKEIDIDKTHEFHSERAEKAAGKAGADTSLPRPAWAQKKRDGGSGPRRPHPADAGRRGSRPPSHQGRNQPDFRRSERDDRPPPPPRKTEPAAERPPRMDEVKPHPAAPANGPRWFEKPFNKKRRPDSDRPSRDDNRRDDTRRDDGDRERPPRMDEAAYDGPRPKRPFHTGDKHKPRSNKPAFGKPHQHEGGASKGGPRRPFAGGKPKQRSSRPPWMSGR